MAEAQSETGDAVSEAEIETEKRPPGGNPTMNAAPSIAAQNIAEEIFGSIEWHTPELGYGICPGKAMHSHPTGRRDFRICLDGIPTVFCFHTSCVAVVEEANHRLRSAIGKASIGEIPNAGKRSLSPEHRQWIETKRTAEALRARAAFSLDTILRDYAWTPADAWEESPARLLDNPTEDWRPALRLFEPHDVVWIGNEKDSCDDDADEQRKVYCRRHFRPVTEWLRESAAPEQLICPNVFKSGVHSRSNQNVIRRRFLVVESDTLTKVEICGVFRWCRQFMELRAIVDTGGKSLHGWFDFPDAEVVDELKIILPALGCDPALFKASQPCRLPGARRGGNIQSLIWFGGPAHG